MAFAKKVALLSVLAVPAAATGQAEGEACESSGDCAGALWCTTEEPYVCYDPMAPAAGDVGASCSTNGECNGDYTCEEVQSCTDANDQSSCTTSNQCMDTAGLANLMNGLMNGAGSSATRAFSATAVVAGAAVLSFFL